MTSRSASAEPVSLPRGPGRAANSDSAETRARLVAAARSSFAERGFDSTSLADVARRASVVASTVYHYFTDKESLYEAVFEETAADLWRHVDEAVANQPTMAAAVAAIAHTADRAATEMPDYGRFLAAVPIEADRRRRFQPLLLRRTEMQRLTFARIASLGHRTGELPPDMQPADVAQQLRSVVVGWLTERYLGADGSALRVSGLLHLLSPRQQPFSVHQG